MDITEMHPQDVLAAIRKVYRSAAAFERAHNLPTKSVHDVMRGRPSARVQRAIEKLLAQPAEASASIRNSGITHRQTSPHPKAARA